MEVAFTLANRCGTSAEVAIADLVSPPVAAGNN
jgi:hypothetical protein